MGRGFYRKGVKGDDDWWLGDAPGVVKDGMFNGVAWGVQMKVSARVAVRDGRRETKAKRIDAFFVNFLHTDPVLAWRIRVGLNWNMGYTLTGNMGDTACSAF